MTLRARKEARLWGEFMDEHLEDVRRYDAHAKPETVVKIVNYLGIALRNPDARFVSCTRKTEMDRIREKFLEKKLRLSARDHDLDTLLSDTSEEMAGDRMKSRVTFYYLLARRAGRLGDFGD